MAAVVVVVALTYNINIKKEEDRKLKKIKFTQRILCVHIQLWMTFTRFVQYIESLCSYLLVSSFVRFFFILSVSFSSLFLYLSFGACLTFFHVCAYYVFFIHNSKLWVWVCGVVVVCVCGFFFFRPFLFPFTFSCYESIVDVHKSSFIIFSICAHTYCLHVSVVRPGLDDDIWAVVSLTAIIAYVCIFVFAEFAVVCSI